MSQLGNSMMMGPNQAYIDYLLSTSVFYYDPFYSGSWAGTPANNDPIGTMNDRYGRATWQLTQAIGISQPLYQANSGKPYLLYDGIDDVLLTVPIDSSLYFPQVATVLMTLNSTNVATNKVALKYIGANAAARLLGVQSNAHIMNWISGGALNVTSAYTSFKVLGGTRVTGTNTKFGYTNGVREVTGNAVNITHAVESMFVGAFRNTVIYAGFQGGIGELVAWGTALSAYDVNLLSKYFMQRRGLAT